MQENELNKFRTIVSEVSSFVGNPLYGHKDEADFIETVEKYEF